MISHSINSMFKHDLNYCLFLLLYKILCTVKCKIQINAVRLILSRILPFMFGTPQNGAIRGMKIKINMLNQRSQDWPQDRWYSLRIKVWIEYLNQEAFHSSQLTKFTFAQLTLWSYFNLCCGIFHIVWRLAKQILVSGCDGILWCIFKRCVMRVAAKVYLTHVKPWHSFWRCDVANKKGFR